MRAKSRKSRQHTTPARTDGVTRRLSCGLNEDVEASRGRHLHNDVKFKFIFHAESAPFLFLSNIDAQPSTSEGSIGRPLACHNAFMAFLNSNFEQFPNSRSSYLRGAFLSKRSERPALPETTHSVKAPQKRDAELYGRKCTLSASVNHVSGCCHDFDVVIVVTDSSSSRVIL